MPREGDKWRVARGDCLWTIAQKVYGKGSRWTDIAKANGLPTKGSPIIYAGQLFTLPGITASSVPPASDPKPDPAPPANTQKPNIVWFSLRADTEREMEAIWEQAHNYFQVRWEIWDLNGHLWLESEEFVDLSGGSSGRIKSAEHTYNDANDRFVCRFSVRAWDKDKDKALSEWSYKEYDFRNNPPGLPPNPDIEIDKKNQITVTIDNIPEDIDADSIEIAIYQDDTNKYRTAKVTINKDARFAKYVGSVDTGHSYKVRIRYVRGSITGPWSDFTNNDQSLPSAPEQIITLRPQELSEGSTGEKSIGVFIEWTPVVTATTYEVQWTTNIEYFNNPGTGGISSQTTQPGDGTKLLISDIDPGHEYFFRVRANNDKGSSIGFTPVKSIKIGSKPSAPTTWSNVLSAILGEDINLYWTHNSTDGSLESIARIHFTIIDSAHPELEPMEKDITVKNTKPPEDQNTNSVYTVNTNDPDWNTVKDGFIIKWKVQTCGIIGEYSDWSTEREVKVFTKPEVEIGITDVNSEPMEEINSFPFYLSILATPPTQTPISYYIEVVANDNYQTVDDVGNVKIINAGDKVYQKYYDPEQNAWKFLIEFSPINIDLENNVNYTITVTVTMDSGLRATASQSFDVYFNDLYYDVYADIVFDKNTLAAAIHPYCNEYEEDETTGQTNPVLSKNCLMSVYRKEYDGTFTEIAKDVENELNIFVTDPHPALDYARYRIVAKTKDTGAISYADIPAVETHIPEVVIQWADKWNSFEYDDSGKGNQEPDWSGSMIRIPYNINTSENTNLDVALVEYVGREHPVSYYGTQVGETAEWSCDIPAYDKELLYQLRRLAKWKGDVYVREQSGVGYWANIKVSFSQTHLETVIPVSFSVTRVEGGM